MKLKKTVLAILPLAIIVLELLPYGAVLNFANQDGNPIRQTYSYFNLTPFGYANFGPFITAVLTCILFVLAAISMFINNKALENAVKTVSALTLATSLMPLLYGTSYFPFVGIIISLLLALEFILSLIKVKNRL